MFSNGAISINNIIADGNGTSGAGNGVYLNNCDLSGSGPCTNTIAKAVTLTGTNDLSTNFNSGLLVYSKGAITVNGLTANNNGDYGADLDNQFTGITQPVTVNGGTFNDPLTNTYNGVTVGIRTRSNGVIKLNSVPMWCPTGVAPGGAGCSIAYPDLQTLVADIVAQFDPHANGVIWIQNTTFEFGRGHRFRWQHFNHVVKL